MECGSKAEHLKTSGPDSVGHAKRLDCGSIAAALESRGMAAAPQRCCGVYESGGMAAAVQTTTASSFTGNLGVAVMECGGKAAAFKAAARPQRQ